MERLWNLVWGRGPNKSKMGLYHVLAFWTFMEAKKLNFPIIIFTHKYEMVTWWSDSKIQPVLQAIEIKLLQLICQNCN